jgi:hypothetical protein
MNETFAVLLRCILLFKRQQCYRLRCDTYSSVSFSVGCPTVTRILQIPFHLLLLDMETVRHI